MVERQAIPSHPHSAHSFPSLNHRHLFLITAGPVQKCTPLSHSLSGLENGSILLTCSTYLVGSTRKPCLSPALITLSLLRLSKNLLRFHAWNLWIKITCKLTVFQDCFSLHPVQFIDELFNIFWIFFFFVQFIITIHNLQQKTIVRITNICLWVWYLLKEGQTNNLTAMNPTKAGG